MTKRECVVNQLLHKETDKVPYTLHFEEEAERITRAYEREHGISLIDSLVQYMSFPATVDTQGNQQQTDGYIIDAYGSKWDFTQKPWHLMEPVLKEPSLSGYKLPTPEDFYKPLLEKKDEILKKANEDTEHFRVISMGWGLFEHTWTLRGFTESLMDSVAEPEFFEACISNLADIYVDIIEHLDWIPAEAYLFGDDWGDQRGVIIGPERWRRFIKPYQKKVYDAVHKQGKFTLQHSCGNIVDIFPDLIEIGMDAHESVQPEPEGMSPYELKRQFGKDLSFWGCLGSQSTIPHATPDELRKEVRRLFTEMPVGGGYIFAPAKGLQEDTPMENIIALVETVLEYN